MQIIHPPALTKGSTIGIFSPSEPLTAERCQRVQDGAAFLESLGFKVRFGEHVYDTKYYMAGDARDRAEDFNAFVRDGSVAAIIASWGGRSCNQILEFIDFQAAAEHPTVICGFSDPSLLLNALFAKAGLITFHGPNVVGKIADNPGPSIEFFLDVVCKGRHGKVPCSPHEPETLRPGRATGRLVGGNLSCLDMGLFGTTYSPQLDGAILFWESGSRTPQEIDQLLVHLRLQGAFGKIAGMVVGFLGGVKDKRDWGARDVRETILAATCGHEFPILYYPCFGHSDELLNPVLPVGALATVDATEGYLTIDEPCVG